MNNQTLEQPWTKSKKQKREFRQRNKQETRAQIYASRYVPLKDKCGHDTIMRNSHRWPHDIIIECSYCHKKYKLEVANGEPNKVAPETGCLVHASSNAGYKGEDYPVTPIKYPAGKAMSCVQKVEGNKE